MFHNCYLQMIVTMGILYIVIPIYKKSAVIQQGRKHTMNKKIQRIGALAIIAVVIIHTIPEGGRSNNRTIC